MDVGIGLWQIQAFLLAMFRVYGIFLFAPVFGSGVIPHQVRVIMSFGLALVLFPFIGSQSIAIPNNTIVMALGLVGELLIGISIGLLARVISLAFVFAGYILGFHMGLRIANVLDPLSELTVSLLGAFFNVVAMLLLLSMNFHHILIRVIKNSYELLPPLGVIFTYEAGEVIIRLGSSIYLFTVQVAAPMLAAIFFIEIIIALLAKMARGFNMMMLQFPLKILISLLIFGAMARAMPKAVRVILAHTVEQIGSLLGALG